MYYHIEQNTTPNKTDNYLVKNIELKCKEYALNFQK